MINFLDYVLPRFNRIFATDWEKSWQAQHISIKLHRRRLTAQEGKDCIYR
jgi:hypothetical protein